jgi:hypothetical protein
VRCALAIADEDFQSAASQFGHYSQHGVQPCGALSYQGYVFAARSQNKPHYPRENGTYEIRVAVAHVAA